MGEGDNRAHRKLKLEAHGDVHHDDAQRDEHPEATLFRKFGTHFRAHIVRTLQADLCVRRLREDVTYSLSNSHRLRGLIGLCHRFVYRENNANVSVGAEAHDHGVAIALLAQGLIDLRDLHRLRKIKSYRGAAGKV